MVQVGKIDATANGDISSKYQSKFQISVQYAVPFTQSDKSKIKTKQLMLAYTNTVKGYPTLLFFRNGEPRCMRLVVLVCAYFGSSLRIERV